MNDKLCTSLGIGDNENDQETYLSVMKIVTTEGTEECESVYIQLQGHVMKGGSVLVEWTRSNTPPQVQESE